MRPHLDGGEFGLDLVREAFVAAAAAGGGYVLDGAPRNMRQARATYQIALELGMTANVALNLHADDHELVHRLLARCADYLEYQQHPGDRGICEPLSACTGPLGLRRETRRPLRR